MRIAVRVDAGPRIGRGHAMRCLTLADTLSKAEADITFASASMPESLAQRIAAAGHGIIRLPPRELQRERGDWHVPPLETQAQVRDAKATELACGAVDWLIVDHYLLDNRWHSAARRFARNILVIDDLANRKYDCDLLVDETGGRTPDDYDRLVPEGAIVLTGADYALLRPEFARERPAAVERRRKPNTANRVLVSLGTTDPGAITAVAVDAVLAAAPDCTIDVVVTRDAESLPRLREAAGQRSGITVHIDSNRMAELMHDADLAIGAAGTTSWERCCLGLPSIALVLAANQRPNAEALERAGAAVMVEDVGGIGPTLTSLISDAARLRLMSTAAFQLTDGLGTRKVADAMLGAHVRTSAVRA